MGQTHASPSPYSPDASADNTGMAQIYEQLVQALRTHWQAHSNAYPQKSS